MRVFGHGYITRISAHHVYVQSNLQSVLNKSAFRPRGIQYGQARTLSSTHRAFRPVHLKKHLPDDDFSRFGPLSSHSDLDLGRLLQARYPIYEHASNTQEHLLNAAFKDHLPQLEVDTVGHGKSIPLGHQQVHFRPRLTQSDLLSDGTDIRFLPGPASQWPYRLWAGGSVSLLEEDSLQLNTGLPMRQCEYVKDCRIIGTSQPERVFVTVCKEISERKVDEEKHPVERNPHGDDSAWDLKMTETYTLCFLREPPGQTSSTKIIKPPTEPLFTHIMRPDANLLFQFSALTHNAHRIHLDPLYAQQHYKFRAPVVHGPLMMVLMLDFLRTSLRRRLSQMANSSLDIICKHIDYRNFAPIFVDEDITLCCKPSKSESGRDLQQVKEWQVWIQSGSGDNASLAVRGNVVTTSVAVE